MLKSFFTYVPKSVLSLAEYKGEGIPRKYFKTSLFYILLQTFLGVVIGVVVALEITIKGFLFVLFAFVYVGFLLAKNSENEELHGTSHQLTMFSWWMCVTMVLTKILEPLLSLF